MSRPNFRCPPEMVLPDFSDEETTTTTTKSRRVSFGTNLIKEFIVGSAVSAQCVSEYEQAFSSSDSSIPNSSHSTVESSTLNPNVHALEENHINHKPYQLGVANSNLSALDGISKQMSKFSSTICFSADSPGADIEFTGGCINLAKSILEKKNKEMTLIISSKSKGLSDTQTKDETKFFEGSQFDMSMTNFFKGKDMRREEMKVDGERTKIFNDSDSEMSKLFTTRTNNVTTFDDSDMSSDDSCKENKIPLNMIVRQLDNDVSDVEDSLFQPKKSLNDVFKMGALDVSSDTEKIVLNQSKQFPGNLCRTPVTLPFRQSENIFQDSPTVPGVQVNCPMPVAESLETQEMDMSLAETLVSEEPLLGKGHVTGLEEMFESEKDVTMQTHQQEDDAQQEMEMDSFISHEQMVAVEREMTMEMTKYGQEPMQSDTEMSIEDMPEFNKSPQTNQQSQPEAQISSQSPRKLEVMVLAEQECDATGTVPQPQERRSDSIGSPKTLSNGSQLTETTSEEFKTPKGGDKTTGSDQVAVVQTALEFSTCDLNRSDPGITGSALREFGTPQCIPDNHEKEVLETQHAEIPQPVVAVGETVPQIEMSEEPEPPKVHQDNQLEVNTQDPNEDEGRAPKKIKLDLPLQESEILVENTAEEREKCEESPIRQQQREVVQQNQEEELQKLEESPIRQQQREILQQNQEDNQKSEESPIRQQQREILQQNQKEEHQQSEESPMQGEILQPNHEVEQQKSEESPVRQQQKEILQLNQKEEHQQSEESPMQGEILQLNHEVEQQKSEESPIRQQQREILHLNQKEEGQISEESPIRQQRREILQQNQEEHPKSGESPIRQQQREIVQPSHEEEQQKSEESPMRQQQKQILQSNQEEEQQKSAESPMRKQQREILQPNQEEEQQKSEESPVKQQQREILQLNQKEEHQQSEESPIRQQQKEIVQRNQEEEHQNSEESLGRDAQAEVLEENPAKRCSKSEPPRNEDPPSEVLEECQGGKHQKSKGPFRKDPPLMDQEVIKNLNTQSSEPGCLWTVHEIKCDAWTHESHWNFRFQLLQSHLFLRLQLHPSREDDLNMYSHVKSVDMCSGNEENPRRREYMPTLRFGLEHMKKVVEEERKILKTAPNVPFFLDTINSFASKLNRYLEQVYTILTQYPGSTLTGSLLSFRLYSFPLLFSVTVSLDLSDLYRLSRESLTFHTDVGTLDERRISAIFETCLESSNPLTEFLLRANEHVIEAEGKTGRVTKRHHVPFLPAHLR